jgi:hypothetical protein
MRKPDLTFTVTVSPVCRVIGCQEQRDQESRGLFGFHSFATCPNCQVIPDGWEMWGENGHKQAAPSTRELMIHWVKLKARSQWRTQVGLLMGYRFRAGSTIYYRGGR